MLTWSTAQRNPKVIIIIVRHVKAKCKLIIRNLIVLSVLVSKIQFHTNKFLEYLKFEKNAANFTLLSYKTDLQKFFEFLNQNKFKHVDRKSLRAFLASLAGQRRKP